MEYIEVDNPTFKGINNLDDLETTQGVKPVNKLRKKHKTGSTDILGHTHKKITLKPIHKHFDNCVDLPSIPDGAPTLITGSETNINNTIPVSLNEYENHLNFKKFIKGVGKDLSKAEKFVIKEVGNIAEATLLLPLLPLRGMMKKAIEKKGGKAPSKFHDLVNTFYNEVVKKHSIAKNPANPAAKGGTYDYPDIDLSSYDQDHQADAIMEIVQAILGFIKDLKKKGLGGALSDLEQTIVGGSNDAVNKIKMKNGMKTKGKKPMNKGIFIGIGAVVLIVILILVFRKK